MMPPFKPSALSLPSCDAVLVQIEHCANALPAVSNILAVIIPTFFQLLAILLKLMRKITGYTSCKTVMNQIMLPIKKPTPKGWL